MPTRERLRTKDYQDQPAKAEFVAGQETQHPIGYRIPGPGIPGDFETGFLLRA